MNTSVQRKGDGADRNGARLYEYLAARIAAEPGLVSMGVQPIDFQAGAVLLPAPAAAALQEQKPHE
jgi:hypothetical protein